MSRYHFSLADGSDNRELLALLRSTAMPGRISLSFQRSPDFFAAETMGNVASQVIVGRDGPNGQIVAVGSRSLRKAFVDGDEKLVGYLSTLRLLPSVRGSRILIRGYQYLRALHSDGQVPFYVTTIMEDNAYAKQVLLGRTKTGMPRYDFRGLLSIFVIPLHGTPRRHNTTTSATTLTSELLPRAIRFLNDFNRAYQFAPSYTQEDFLGTSRPLRGFCIENFYAYIKGNDVVGTLGVWDQSECKQTVVAAYAPALGSLRCLHNGIARLTGGLRLPKVGERFPFLYGAFLSAADPEILRSLLCKVRKDWSGRGYSHLFVGLPEGSPLATALRGLSAMTLNSSVYLVYWDDPAVEIPSRQRVPHLEIATL